MTVCHAASPKAFKRILFATDLSESSDRAFTFTLDMAKTFQAQVLAIHALGGPVLTSRELDVPVEAEKLTLEEMRRRLQSLVTEGSRQGIEVQTLTADGPAAPAILKAAVENDSDLIVLAIESKGIIERTLLGTTAEQVVRDGRVPVLSVPVQVEAKSKDAEPVS